MLLHYYIIIIVTQQSDCLHTLRGDNSNANQRTKIVANVKLLCKGKSNSLHSKC